MSSILLKNSIIPIEKISPHPKNYRRHSEQQIQQLMSSLMRFGQARSICVQEKGQEQYTVVAGEGIWKAAKWLGWGELKADIFPGNVSETEIRAYLVADNKLQGQDADEETLLILLQEQEKAGFSLGMIGSSEKEMQRLLGIFASEQTLLEEKMGISFSSEENTISNTTSENSSEKEKGIEQPVFQPYIPQIIGDIPAIASRATPEEKFDKFENSLVRQIVLYFSPEEYAWMLARLKQVRGLYKQLETNTDVFVYLLQEYAKQLPDIEIADPFQEKINA